VRIDPTNRPDAQNRLSGPNAKPPRSDGAQPAAQSSRLQTAEAVHESYIRKAAACDDVDTNAVAEARRLIESGQLDTPEAIAEAAANIVARGI